MAILSKWQILPNACFLRISFFLPMWKYMYLNTYQVGLSIICWQHEMFSGFTWMWKDTHKGFSVYSGICGDYQCLQNPTKQKTPSCITIGGHTVCYMFQLEVVVSLYLTVPYSESTWKGAQYLSNIYTLSSKYSNAMPRDVFSHWQKKWNPQKTRVRQDLSLG